MHIRSKKNLHVFLSIWLIVYTIIGTGHFGHIHFYGRADVGFCTSQCHNPNHHNVKPNCKGFPVNLTMGVDAHPGIVEPRSPEFQAANIYKEGRALDEMQSTDRSRAPPIS